MTSLPYQNHISGPKTIARRISMTGHYLPTDTARTLARHVVSLPGYDRQTNTCNLDVLQGMYESVIASDATIWGVEYESDLVRPIRRSANASGIDLRLSYCDLRDFVPPQKLDMFIGDLMCLPHEWIGEYLVNRVVPHMKKRHSSIAVNMCVQFAFGTGSQNAMSVYRQVYEADPNAYLGDRGWDLSRPQDPAWAAMDVLETQKTNVALARSIAPKHGLLCYTGNQVGQEACFLSFVGIHRYMKDTDFPNTTLMLTLYYDRG
jgi:hypothetical protein